MRRLFLSHPARKIFGPLPASGIFSWPDMHRFHEKDDPRWNGCSKSWVVPVTDVDAAKRFFNDLDGNGWVVQERPVPA
jgi:hypothetical protein